MKIIEGLNHFSSYKVQNNNNERRSKYIWFILDWTIFLNDPTHFLLVDIFSSLQCYGPFLD